MRQAVLAKKEEVTYAVGAEYSYQDSFAMRMGYFHESPLKGARQFLSLELESTM
jgi:long-subunit fatty acid transport protein